MKLLASLLITLQVFSAQQVKDWCAEGLECVKNGDGLGAAEYYAKCYDAVGGTGMSGIALSQSLYNISLIYEEAGDYEEAEKYIVRAIELGNHLKRWGSQVLRYLEASRICAAKGKMDDALNYALKGMNLATLEKNNNAMGLSYLQVGDCYRAMGKQEKTDSLYKEAVRLLNIGGKNKPFMPSGYLKLGDNATTQGDTASARYYYEQILDPSSLGYDYLKMLSACQRLSDLLKTSDPDAAKEYAVMADSLSFATAIDSLGKALAISNIEFPRREREMQLATQHKMLILSRTCGILAFLLAITFCILMSTQRRARKKEEQKNAELVKAALQKDALLSITTAAVREMDEYKKISEDETPLPQIKLTKREIQIARLASQGMQNKEIADELGISVGTVAVHKNNLFRKLGVGNTVELLRYMQKVGL